MYCCKIKRTYDLRMWLYFSPPKFLEKIPFKGFIPYQLFGFINTVLESCLVNFFYLKTSIVANYCSQKLVLSAVRDQMKIDHFQCWQCYRRFITLRHIEIGFTIMQHVDVVLYTYVSINSRLAGYLYQPDVSDLQVRGCIFSPQTSCNLTASAR